MIPDYDRVMSFLANTEMDEIVRMAAHPRELEAALSRNSSALTEEESLEPDTLEAWESATEEGERDDRAEEMIYQLLEESPETWVTFKQTVRKLAPEEDIGPYLERYGRPNIWEWPSPLENREDDSE